MATLTNESLFDVILAKMWTDFYEKASGGDEDNYGFSHTRESFNSIKDAYTLYYKDDRKNRNLTSVRQLQELSRSLALREKFAKLTVNFLEYIVVDKNIALNGRYLVIPIDDLDLASDKSLSILEQMRIFLSVPHVIILTTVNIEKLLMCGNKMFANELIAFPKVEEYERILVKQYADQYIAKALPRNSRIYMPQYGGSEARNYIVDYEKYIVPTLVKVGGMQNRGNFDYISFCNMIVSKYLNLILTNKYDTYYGGESLRNIVNKTYELWTISCTDNEYTKDFVFKWLEKEVILSINSLNSQKSVSFMKQLLNVGCEDVNELILRDIRNEKSSWNQKILRNQNNYGYGKLLHILTYYYVNNIEKRDLISKVILLYSLRIIQYISEKEYASVDSFFVRGDIFSSLGERQAGDIFGKKQKISELLRFELKCNLDKDDAGIIIINNLEMLENIFKILLFCDIDSIICKIVLERSSAIQNVKQIPLIQEHELENVEESKGIIILEVKEFFDIASMDFFFKNLIRYDELLKKYVLWLYRQISHTLNKTANNREFDSFYKRSLQKGLICAKKMENWKKKYSVGNIYDLLPVQNVGVMLDVLKRFENFSNYKREGKIASIMSQLTEAFIVEFGEAEQACAYAECGYFKYSEKFREAMSIINLENVPPDIQDRWLVRGQEIEDTFL